MADLVWEDVAGNVQTLAADATLREVYTGAATVSEHAIENGSVIVDHVRQAPDRVALELYVSDSPADVPRSHLSGIRGSVQKVDVEMGHRVELARESDGRRAAQYRKVAEKATAEVLRFDQAVGRVVRVLDELRRLKEQAILVTVYGLAVELENMVIVSVSAPQDVTDGESCTFRVELVSVRLVSSEVVEVPEPDEPRGRSTTDAGATATEESEAPESLWHSIMGL